jgi:3-hydroxyisobutyrate dehydrogenase-like beta-hydroxyacid dehydrogenase
MEVGFLGLGIMGKAMASRLLKHGFRVTVWNRTLSKVFPFSSSSSSLFALCLRVSGVFVCVTDQVSLE